MWQNCMKMKHHPDFDSALQSYTKYTVLLKLERKISIILGMLIRYFASPENWPELR